MYSFIILSLSFARSLVMSSIQSISLRIFSISARMSFTISFIGCLASSLKCFFTYLHVQQDNKEEMFAHIFPMGDAKDLLVTTTHCRHLSVWVTTLLILFFFNICLFVCQSGWQHCANLQHDRDCPTLLLVSVTFLLYSSWIFLAASVKYPRLSSAALQNI